MIFTAAHVLVAIAALPFVYYALVIFSSWRFFGRSLPGPDAGAPFAPQVSNLKPVRGLDPGAYENFASLCRQNYPEYEILFCAGSSADPVVPVIKQLIEDFPDRNIRLLYATATDGANDKVAKLALLASEARYDVFVLSDSDVRVEPDYLKTIVAPLRDPSNGAVTCFYIPSGNGSAADKLHAAGMLSDFYAGILVARQLDGVKFALGTTIATTRRNIDAFGGFDELKNRPADDLLVGRLIAESGFNVEILPFAISTIEDYPTLRDLFLKRLRWMVVMRHMRPWGHFGLLFTFGLPWSLAAIGVHPTAATAAAFLAPYLLCRALYTWMIGGWGLRQAGLWRTLLLIPAWDLFAFAVWLASFARNNLRWRQGAYALRGGKLVAVGENTSRE